MGVSAVESSDAGPGSAGLRSVGISTRVLDCFTHAAELGPSQVARELGVAKSTAYAALAALTGAGLLERSGHGRYRLSLRLFDYGQLVLDRLPVRRVARPVLLALHDRLGEMLQLGIPAAGHVVYAERFGESHLGPEVHGEVLRKVPGYASSAGRAMAAFDEQVAEATMALPRRRHTPFTTVDPVRLHRILAGGRARGWVRSADETVLGYTSIAAPVLDADRRVVAAVSAVGPTRRMCGPRGDFVARSLVVATREISGLMATHLEE